VDGNASRARILDLVILLCLAFVAASTPPIQGAPLPSPQPPQMVQDAPLPAPPPLAAAYPPQELDRLVSPIALYPDPLLAQLLTTSTFSPEVPEAARWADQHHYLPPASLAAAITADQLPWEPSVQALLPFPSVLGMMASDMPWTEELGSAFLTDPQSVMDAVQRMRQLASSYGYLRSNGQIIVRGSPYIEILPANPAFMVVPYYSPGVVFVSPRRGFAAASAIRYGFGVSLGTAFAPYGWGTTHFVWGSHALIVNNAPWGRTWANRAVYVHPYAVPRRAVVRVAPRAVEQHRAIVRSPRERQAERDGRGRPEEHRRKDKDKPR
jgi:hypothetical protein